ncbi:hypothetical protein EST38_g12771, partial [Candolleomyces aberdarensis]
FGIFNPLYYILPLLYLYCPPSANSKNSRVSLVSPFVPKPLPAITSALAYVATPPT